MRIVIDAGGRRVELETADANMTPAALRTEALAVWRETADAGRSGAGPAGAGGGSQFGFANPHHEPLAGGFMREIKAES